MYLPRSEGGEGSLKEILAQLREPTQIIGLRRIEYRHQQGKCLRNPVVHVEHRIRAVDVIEPGTANSTQVSPCPVTSPYPLDLMCSLSTVPLLLSLSALGGSVRNGLGGTCGGPSAPRRSSKGVRVLLAAKVDVAWPTGVPRKCREHVWLGERSLPASDDGRSVGRG